MSSLSANDVFFDYLSNKVIELENESIDLKNQKEAYSYAINLITTLNMNADFLIEELVKNEKSRDTFKVLISQLLGEEEVNNFLQSIKNLYYLTNMKSYKKEYVKPQEVKELGIINNFKNDLNIKLQYLNNRLIENRLENINKELTILQKIVDDIQYGIKVDDVDTFRRVVDESSLTEEEKEDVLFNALVVNSMKDEEVLEDYYDKIDTDTLDDFLMDDENLKRIISLFEQIDLNNINLDNYMVDGNYTDDIGVYLEFSREKMKDYIKINRGKSIDEVFNIFLNEEKRYNQDKAKKIVFFNGNSSSVIDDVLLVKDKKDNNQVNNLFKSISVSDGEYPENEDPILIEYVVNTISGTRIKISYTIIDNYVLILGISNKKFSDHKKFIVDRIRDNEISLSMLIDGIVSNDKDILNGLEDYSLYTFEELDKNHNGEIIDDILENSGVVEDSLKSRDILDIRDTIGHIVNDRFKGIDDEISFDPTTKKELEEMFEEETEVNSAVTKIR